MKLLTRKIPLFYFLLLVVISATAISYFFLNPVKIVEKSEATNSTQFELIRSKYYEYTQPLMLVETQNESPALQPLKQELEEYYKTQEAALKVKSVSVYCRELNSGAWFGINPDELYSPGSLMKVTTFLTYLKESEINPKLLSQKILFEKHFSELPTQQIVEQSLIPGRQYSVKELLEAMIENSDNDAVALLNSQTNFKIYFALLKDIGLSIPSLDQKEYPISVTQYSRFLRILFNSSFLSQENSEYALQVLCKSKFKDGIAKLLPSNISFAHKFGERFLGNDQQLHESGIVYLNNHPFLLTVMTRGDNPQNLKEILSITGKTVFNFMDVH